MDTADVDTQEIIIMHGSPTFKDCILAEKEVSGAWCQNHYPASKHSEIHQQSGTKGCAIERMPEAATGIGERTSGGSAVPK